MSWTRHARRLTGGLLAVFVLAGCQSKLQAFLMMSSPPDAVPSDAELTLEFSRPMDPESAEIPLVWTPPLAVTYRWDDEHTHLMFSAQRGFAPGRSYTFIVSPELKTADGDPFDKPVGWTITTRPTPRVVDRHDEQIGVSGQHYRFRVQFDLPMNEETVVRALRVTPEAALSTSWAGSTLTIETSEPLTPGTLYRFEIGKEARAASGAQLPSAYTWSVSVPKLVRSVRTPGASSPSGPLALEFNYPIDFAAFQDLTSILPEVPGSWTYDATSQRATYWPDRPFSLDTTFVVRWDGPIRSEDGEVLAPLAPVQFRTPPPVLSITPGGSRLASIGSPIVIGFARNMDQDSVEARFHITPAVEGTFEWNGASVTFRPKGGMLTPETTYTITLDAGLEDASGEVVQTVPLTRSFTTEERRPLAWFAYNVEVLLGAPGEAIVFPFYRDTDIGPVTVQAYRLSEDQFVDRYLRHYRGGQEQKAVSWEGAQLAAQWQQGAGRCGDPYGCDEHAEWADGLAPGFYLVNLVGLEVEDQRFLIVVGHFVTVKSYGGQVLAWVTTRDGRPVADADIAVYTENGLLADEGDTDGDGVYETWVFGGSPPALVVSHAGQELGVVGIEWLWAGDRYMCGYLHGDPHGSPPSDSVQMLAQIHTDRPIYRPGDTVHFKAILRRDQDGLVDLPDLTRPVTIRIRDGRDNLLQTIELTPSRFGTVNGEFHLAEGAMLGAYSIQVETGQDTVDQVFKVEEYRKPDYQVTVTTQADQYVSGESIQATIEASYLLGEPVAGAQVTVQLYALYDWGWNYIYPEQIAWTRSGTTDENGRWSLTFSAPDIDRYSWERWSTSLSSMRLGVEATVDDGSHQTVSNLTTRTIYNASAYVALDTQGYMHARGHPVPFHTEVRTIDGEPLAGQTLTYSVSRWSSLTWEKESVTTLTAVSESDGLAEVDFTPDRSGWFEVEVTSRDTGGNVMMARRGFYVGGTQEARYGGGRLQITADRDSYAPGGTATLLIESDFAGQALLTMERASVRRHELIRLTPPVTSVEVPIRTDDVPNIYATVTAWIPADPEAEYELRMGGLGTANVELTVPPAGRELTVTISPSQTVYAPGEKATFHIEVRGPGGDPAGAELSLALVDEAIFSLSPDLSPALLETFHGPRAHLVETFDTFSSANYLFAEGCGGGGGGDIGAINPRSDFPDTALWLPRVETGDDGAVDVQVTMPESLTTWRLTVRAIALDSRVGEATSKVLTTQPLVIRPLLPRLMVEGDAAQVAAAVHNYSDGPQTVTATLATRGLTVGAGARQTFTLQAGEVRVVTWEVVAGRPGEAELTFRAQGQDASDAVLLPLTVERLAVRQVFLQSGDFDQRASVTFEQSVGVLPDGGLWIEVGRDVAASLLDGLEDLTRFPYGCVEQTMSAVLPNAVIANAFRALHAVPPGFEEELRPRVDDGLMRLYGLQHYDGGWGWWFDDESDNYQTAWVLLGLSLTRDAGYPVDPAVLDRGSEWLSANLDSMDSRTEAFALYSLAMAGYGETNRALDLARRAEALDPFSQAALALALQTGGDADAAGQVVDLLAVRAENHDGLIHWPIPWDDGEYNDKTMASDVRATALALVALQRIDNPYADLLGGIARWLMGQRREFGWGTTNETAFAILGLTDYMVAATARDGTSSYQILVNGEIVAAGSLDAETPSAEAHLAPSDLRSGPNAVVLTETGAGRLYYLVRVESYSPEPVQAADGPILIRRLYLDPKSKRPLDRVEPGQLVLVQLSFRLPEDGQYMIVEDHPPAGLEPLNERLNTTSYMAWSEDPYTTGYLSLFFWEEYGYNYKEIRDGRVSFFVRSLPEGTHTFDYLARATHAGTFIALPAEVWAMYKLELWGRSASASIEISMTAPAAGEGTAP